MKVSSDMEVSSSEKLSLDRENLSTAKNNFYVHFLVQILFMFVENDYYANPMVSPLIDFQT